MAATCNGDSIVDLIPRTECIGNSLKTINRNFVDLDAAVCRTGNTIEDLATTLSNNLLPWVINARLSLDPNDPEPRVDIRNSQNIYLHPYKGNQIALWNAGAKRWELKELKNTLVRDLLDCEANTNYDIFLYHDGIDFFIELEKWGSQLTGHAPPTLNLQNGVRVKAFEPNKRLIGCLRTTLECRTEMSFGKTAVEGGSHPKLFLWNAYNQIPLDFSILDSGSNDLTIWTTTTSGDTAQTNGPFEKLSNSPNNKVSLITRDFVNLTLDTIHTCENAAKLYFIHSLNRETPTVAEYLAETPGKPIYESYGNHTVSFVSNNILRPGYHYFQMATMTYSDQKVILNLWKNDRHSYGTTGYLPVF